MNEFHEINMLTSHGDINGALALISKWSDSIARKIMKKAGYSVTPHAGRAFWTWVQATLTASQAATVRRQLSRLLSASDTRSCTRTRNACAVVSQFAGTNSPL
ncbi:UNVERIFIED_ORG: hypothetical protein C7430_11727 [Pantoea agglomerans]|uniref:Uncharacterized protein n=1 Tax=Enterobacter agglomerans TaxID=549 RepID=A0ABD6XJT5_ENTAG